MLNSASDLPGGADAPLSALGWAAGHTIELAASRFGRACKNLHHVECHWGGLSTELRMSLLSTSVLQVDLRTSTYFSITQLEGPQHNHSALLSFF